MGGIVMSKGRKFTAAEKHFYEKELTLRQEMRKTEEWAEQIINVNNQLAKENKQLKKDFDELKEKYDKLLKYKDMTNYEIETALKTDQMLSGFGAITNNLSKYF